MNLIQLRPDDVLVVSCPQHLTPDQRSTAIARLRTVLGADQSVVVLDGGQSIEVLRLPTGDNHAR